MNDNHIKYISLLASKGGLISESKTILREIYSGQDHIDLRNAVINDDILDKGTLENRRNVWRELSRRYLKGRSENSINTLATFAVRCPNLSAINSILFYEYCQADALLRDMTIDCTYRLYQNARTILDNSDLNEWLIQQEIFHPEIAEWSPKTRSKIARSYLTTIRDFGLVVGKKQKSFHKFFVPREAFVYALYHQKDRGIEGKALIQSPYWRLFLLNEREVVFMLQDVAAGGFIQFRYSGDIFDLRFEYDNLAEVVDVITA